MAKFEFRKKFVDPPTPQDVINLANKYKVPDTATAYMTIAEDYYEVVIEWEEHIADYIDEL